MIWALILAAGESKRMGEPKLLLPYGEKSLIESVVDSAVRSKADGTLIVLGFKQEEIRKKIRSHSVQVTVNPDYQSGMLSSVQKGIRSIPGDAEAVVVILADQPGVDPSVINLLIDSYEKSGMGIHVPVYNRARGHPVLIDMKYGEEILTLSLEIGLRELLLRHPDDICEIEVESPGVLIDVDNQEDYDKALKRKLGVDT